MADWLDILANGTKPSDIADAAYTGTVQGVQLRQQQQAEQQRVADAVRMNAYRNNVAAMLKSGDYMGAAGAAYAAGDDKAGAGFGTLQKQHFDQNDTNLTHQGELYRAIGSLPYEQRKTALQAVKPQLMAMGHTSDEIDAFDPTDTNVAPFMGLGYSAHDKASDTTAAGNLVVNQQNADTNRQNADTQSYEAHHKLTTVDHDVFDQEGNLVARGLKQEVVAPGASVYDGPTTNYGAPQNGNGYDVVLGNGKFGSPSSPLSQMSVGAVLDFGRNTLIPATRNNAQLGLAGTGLGSSAVGRYQITGSTLAKFAPAVLGPDWRSKPFDAAAQEKLGEAIFNASRGGDLSKVWTSLSPAQARQVAQMPWEQARNIIAAGESGGRQQVSTQGGIVAKAAPKPTPGQDAAGNYDQNMIDQQAKTYLLTGKMPQLGQGSGPLRTVILNRASHYMTENSLGPGEIQAVRAQHAALTGSMAAQAKAYGQAMGQLGTFNTSLDHYMEASKNAAQTNFPGVNAIANGVYYATGKPVTAMQDAAITAGGEYSKLMTGMGQSSDAARADAAKLFNPNLSPQQREANAAMARANIEGRRKAYEAQLGRTRDQIASLLPNTQRRGVGAKSDEPLAGRTAPAGATRTATGPGGQRLALVGGKWTAF